MKVSELIQALKAYSPDKPVHFHIEFDNEPDVVDVIDNPDCILLGHNIPSERYEEDYRYAE